jgi:hypothetical protein
MMEIILLLYLAREIYLHVLTNLVFQVGYTPTLLEEKEAKLQQKPSLEPISKEKGVITATTMEITLSIGGMTCASCVGIIENVLKAENGILEASVNLAMNSGMCNTHISKE